MKIAIRTDASGKIGSGHMARCLTLAQALRGHGAAVELVCRHISPSLRARAESAGVRVLPLPPAPANRPLAGYEEWLGTDWQTDAAQTRKALAGEPRDWLVVDHYALDERWENAVRDRARKLAVIDDLADRPHRCELLLDQNFSARGAHRYDGLVPRECVRLLGPRFCLLAPEFRALREAGRERDGGIKQILIFFGGADPENATGKALRALEPLLVQENLAAHVVAGSLNPHLESLRAAVTSVPGATLHVDTPRMAELTQAADLAIAAGGMAAWERCCLGLPTVALMIAENQRAGLEALGAAGHALYLGDAKTVSADALESAVANLLQNPDQVRQLSRSAAAVVDGLGTDRVARRLLAPEIRLRRAREEDREPIFRWRNDPRTRAQFFDPRELTFAEHSSWFTKVLANGAHALLVGETADGEAIGVLRFDPSPAGDEAVVSVYLLPDLHGKGFGAVLLRAGTSWVSGNLPAVKLLRAEVLPTNPASRQAFRDAGYEDHGSFFEVRP